MEAVASGTAIVRMAEDAIKLDKDSILARMVRDHEGELEPDLVVEAALREISGPLPFSQKPVWIWVGGFRC
ncbi:hypothetical protein [Algoriphagus boritolerans]|uniref:hypothetical protein n=1 Tax=Algoriphagus boritolerans TaxID=308111 RepID=UPI000AF78525